MGPSRRARLLANIPEHIKEEAVRRAETNLNDEIVGVLARRLGVRFDPSGYRVQNGAVASSSGKTLLRLPERLKHKLVMSAVRNRTNQTTEVCAHLAEEYGLDYDPPGGARAPVGGGSSRPRA